MRKGLSPIISVILVLLIAIATTVLVVMWLPRLTIKIFNVESSFNQSYVRSRGCLNIEYVDPYKREITIKNCGKISLSDFKLFIDSNKVSLVFIGDIKPMEETVVNYNKCLSKRDFYDFYLTADLAESPAIKVDLSLPIVALDSVPSTIENNESYYCIDEDMHSSDTMFSFAPGVSNVVLDCNGHELSGDRSWGSTGIYLSGNHNITIRNCKITDFWSGIYLRDYSDGNNINNVTTYDNDYGIYFTESSDNKITNSKSSNNNAYDFLIETYNEKCNNDIKDLIGTDDLPIYYHSGSPVTISGWDNTVSEIVLCDADNSNINNVNLERIGRRNNGILLVGTDDSTIDNVNVKGYEAGIKLYNSLNNQITNIIADENDYGIYVHAGSHYNNLDNVIATWNYYGLLIEGSEKNKISNSNLLNSDGADFYIYPWGDDSCKNQLTNVKGTENKPIFYHNNSAITISGWDNNVSEIVLCDADGSTITNVNLNRDELNYPENNMILLTITDYANITDVNVTDFSRGIMFFYSSNNILNNVRAYSNDEYGLHIFGDSYNNTITNSRMIDNERGIFMDSWGDYPANNNITNCFISQNLDYDYYFSLAGETNSFTNTNFTAPRTIRFGDLPSWFNYRNNTASSIWLKTTVSSSSTITRKLINLNKTLIQWNDSSSGSVTATYNVSGLFLNNYYNVYDNSALLYSLFSGSNGQITFTINLPANQEHEIKVKGICDYYLFNSDMPYNISNSNKLYCLVENVNINNKNAVNFSSGTQNSTLYCGGSNISGNGVTNTYGIYLTGINTKNNTINNCNLANFGSGIYINNGSGNKITNVTSSSNSLYGININSSSNNTFTGGSLHNNVVDYYLKSAGTTNNFTNTNFTPSRKIYFADSTSWFIYNNETTGNIWLKNNVSAASNITRKLVNWDNALMQWNDTFSNTSGSITARYNITGLLTNANYNVYDNSFLVYTKNSGFSGEISFTINLPANEEHMIMVNRSNNVLLFNFNEENGLVVHDKTVYKNDGIFYGETFNDGAFNGESFNNGIFNGETFNDGISYSGATPTDLHNYNGKFGRALAFDGVNDYVSVSYPSQTFSSFSYEFWIKWYKTGSGQVLINQQGGDALWVLLDRDDDNKIGVYLGGTNNKGYHKTNSQIMIGVWTHFAITYNGTHLKMYINGTLDNTIATSGIIDFNSFTMGSREASVEELFSGTMDEVRLWNRPLTQAEIQVEMNSSLPISRPVASYRFEESGNYVNDTHIRVNGTYGSALSFDGVDDYINAGNDASLNITNIITVEAWVNYNQLTSQKGSSQFILMKGDSFKFGTEYQTLPNDEFPGITMGEDGTPKIDRTMAFNGSNSVKYFRTVNASSSLTSRYISVPNETEILKLHGVNKGQNVVQGQYTYNILAWHARYYNITFGQLDQGSADLGGNTGTFDWTVKEAEKSFRAGFPNTTYYRIQTLGLSGCTGTGWWDDIQIKDENDNLLFYSSFEDDKLWFKIKDTRPQVGWVGVAADQLIGWHHYVGTYDGNYLKIYTDGILKASLLHRGNITSSTSNLIIGNSTNGTIDEVRIWNRSLTQAEIQAEMNSSRPVQRPIASYSFEEPASATYVNDTHIRVNGTYGSALNFDGNDDYVSISGSSDFNINNELTVSAWIYPLTNQFTEGSSQIVQRLDWVNKKGFFLREGYENSHIPEFFVGNGTAWQSASAGSIIPNNWYYVTGTVKSNDKIRIYINGSLKDESNYLGIINQITGNIFIGWESGTKAFNGTIDEVRIFNRVLSLTEIQAEMNSSMPVSRPVASYRFEESGQYANDTHIWVKGVYGSALSFDGASDFVNVSNSVSLNPKSITLEAWIKPEPTGDYQLIINKWADDYEIIIDSSGHLHFASRNSLYIINWVNSNLQVSWNAWQHVAATYNGTHTVFYLNGTSDIQPSNYGDIYTADTNQVCIGCMSYWRVNGGSPDFFKGVMDEVRIWNRVLSQTEIQAEMNEG